MAKRLTEKQKGEMTQGFKDGKTIEVLSAEFNCTRTTTIRNLKINLGEASYEELKKSNKKLIKKNILEDSEKKKEVNSLKNEEGYKEGDVQEHKKSFQIANEKDFYPDSSFLEITPLNFEIDNAPRKEFSSVPISDIDFPQIVYMIVDKKIELEVKLLKDFPEWDFLPTDDLNRKSIEIYFDLKVAKRFCNKEQKVLKVPNSNVFKIAAPFLISKGITRIVSSGSLIAL
ncbi:MAG: hypothetical protein JJ848_000130 [Prochlorococcus marinus CUG1439]|uniref:hypothetical protein n=1 Tax=Prochlorococcus sp. MIT 1314 TaxID=3096220 RepID=UPI001AFDAAD4|nr:hypothetical protein [Prochlorococcus sp. MIT 1314]MCR8538750.1 hypothetical protein [Prochlorococcus marinus CUG1439]